MSRPKLTGALLLGTAVGASVTVGGGEPDPRPIIRGAPLVPIIPGPMPIVGVGAVAVVEPDPRADDVPPPDPHPASNANRTTTNNERKSDSRSRRRSVKKSLSTLIQNTQFPRDFPTFRKR